MIIYKAENTITGEIYIGQTKKKLYERKRDHIYEAFKRSKKDKFHSALVEFGTRAFTWDIVQTAKSYKQLANLEKDIIKKYDSIDFGYNTSLRHDLSANGRINKSNYRNGFLKVSKP